jgi:hypothetical protein
MISSANSFGGISAADILKLFGVPSSSSSISTPASTAQTASPGVSVSSANDPINAIKAILAQAQIEHAQTGNGTATSITAQTTFAYAVQMDMPESSAPDATFSVAAKTTPAAPASSGSATDTAGETNGGGANFVVGFASSSSASGSDNEFQLGLSVGGNTTALAFAMDGTASPLRDDGNSIDFGQGGDAMMFQVGVSADGQYEAFTMTLEGLDANEAQQALTAFKDAVTSPGDPGLSSSTWGFNDNEDEGSGFSVDYMAEAYQMEQPVVIVQDTLSVTVANTPAA